MNSFMFTAALKKGEILNVRTETSTYWIKMENYPVAEVYRRGNAGIDNLGKRKLSSQIVEHEGFTMYDLESNPVSAIVPLEFKKVTSIPFHK